MLRKSTLFAATLVLSMLLLAGCKSTKKEATQEMTPAPTQAAITVINTPTTASTPTRVPSLCDNIYQPSRVGNAWTYAGSNTAITSYTKGSTITNSSATSFTAENTLSNITYPVSYTCTTAGIVADNPVEQYLGALLNAPGSQISVKLNSTSGISLPASIHPGDQWQQTADVDATINGTNTSGWLIFKYSAVGNESVTVPSGTYDALRVDLTITIQVTPLRIGAGTYQSTLWMAPNVGIVRTEGTSHVPGIDFTDTTQLSSFSPAP